jgi:hypothetical protein
VAELFIQEVAVAFELAPPYVVELPAMTGMFADAEPGHLEPVAHLGAIAAHAGIPLDRLRWLAEPPGDAEPVDRVLRAIGAPPAPQPMILVQDAPDRDPFATTLPRLIQEAGWLVTEELTLTHLGAGAGCAVLDFLSWWADPEVGATVILSHQPVFVRDDQVPQRLTAVGLRFGATGRLAVRGWEPAGPVRGHACEGWPDVSTALAGGRLRRGETLQIRSGASRIRLEFTGAGAPAQILRDAGNPVMSTETVAGRVRTAAKASP